MSRLLAAIFLILLPGLLAACGSAPNVITWETASEVNTAGFNLYRGPTAEGPWSQVNTALIPPASDPVRGGKYEYRDTAPVDGQAFYMLEEIDLDGVSTRYPPTQLAPANQYAWLLWVGLAALAVGVGWVIGGRRRARRSAEDGAHESS